MLSDSDLRVEQVTDLITTSRSFFKSQNIFYSLGVRGLEQRKESKEAIITLFLIVVLIIVAEGAIK